MRAIKIDVIDKTITEVDIEPGIDPIYEQLACDVFTCPMMYPNRDAVYVDDESLLKDLEQQYGAFKLKSYPSQCLFGHGLIIGSNIEGESEDAKSTLEFFQSEVEFLNEEQVVQEFTDLSNRGFEIYVY